MLIVLVSVRLPSHALHRRGTVAATAPGHGRRGSAENVENRLFEMLVVKMYQVERVAMQKWQDPDKKRLSARKKLERLYALAEEMVAHTKKHQAPVVKKPRKVKSKKTTEKARKQGKE